MNGNTLVSSLECQIQSKYGKHATWLKDWTIDQLKQMIQLIVLDITYEELHQFVNYY